jgi:hypothetical protein
MKFIYTIVENGETYPNAFTSYNDALDEVKKKHYDWRDNEEDEVNVEEGHKIGKINDNPNITELYIEKEIFIYIYKLTLASKQLRRHSIG